MRSTPAPITPASPPAIPWQPTLAVVDDEPDFLYLMDWGARRSGLFRQVHTLVGSENAAAFFALVQDDALIPDAILVDWRMPKLNGLELIGILRQQRLLRSTPIIAMSGAFSEADCASAIRAGYDAFLLKPFGLDAMLRVCSRIRALCRAPQ